MGIALLMRRVVFVAPLWAAMGVCAFEPEAASDPEADRPLLSGPRVESTAVPGLVMSMGGDMRAATELRPREWGELFRSFMDEALPEGIRFTDEQRRRIEGLYREHQRASRAYERAHQEELRSLRRLVGNRRDGAPSDRADRARAEEIAEARARQREIRAGAPRLSEALTRIWNELSSGQRVELERRIDARRAARRAEEMGEMGEMGDAQQGSDRPVMSDNRARRERLLLLFSQLGADEQEALLERLEGYMRDRRRDSVGPNRRAAPGIDRVRVPKPRESHEPNPNDGRNDG